jgi:nickel transport system ATP-binding protein
MAAWKPSVWKTRSAAEAIPFEMSGGMLQRMMIALALLSEAPFIIADEPTTDLDAVAQARILDLLAVLCSTAARDAAGHHDMGVVARLADDVAVMENGASLNRAMSTLFSAPQHRVSRAWWRRIWRCTDWSWPDELLSVPR